MSYFVYELVNLMGTIEYVGRTKDPRRRFGEHTRTKPNKKNTNGMFYGRQDLLLNVVKSFDDIKDANKLEGELKLSYGINWTEKERDVKAGKNNISSGHLDKIRKLAHKKNRRPILVYKNNVLVHEFNSVDECISQLKTHNVQKVIQGKRSHEKGYTFKYKEI